MPPRLNKRQQRELEELEALASTKPSAPIDASSEEEDAPGPSYSRGGGGFASLLVPDDDNDSEEEEAKTMKSKKSKKKKKKTTEPNLASPPPAVKDTPKSTRTSTPSAPAKNEKRALKKAKAKERKAANEELDQALAELSIQYPASQKISHSASGKQSLAALLSVSLQNLDAEAEMRRFFGSKVVQATKAESSSSRKKAPTVRSNLTRPQATWWAAKGREGLSLRSLTPEEEAAKLTRQLWEPLQEKWWTIEYSKKYKSMTKAFMQTVLSGDPQGFWDLLGTLPWHADTLLQISEVYRHREEHAQAVDFIDRAMFTYERALIGAFTFTSGLNRLDFDRVENRPFFLAVHRQVSDLQRRGCVRTAFEFARLMYSLDPWNDPHGALFHLDFVAIKSGMHQWLLDVYDVFEERRKKFSGKQDTRMNPALLPGWSFARALALKVAEDATQEKDHSKSRAVLKEAAHDFPSIVPLLADKLDATLPANLRAHRDFRIETEALSMSPPAGVLHLLSHLYVQRSAPVWKDHTAWFTATITEAFSTLPSSLPTTERKKAFLTQYQNLNLRYSVYRHVMVLETSYRRLFSFIPRQVLEAKSLSCDPLPPPTSISQYDQEFFQAIDDIYSPRMRSRRQRELDERRLAQLLPDAAFRQQLQAFFEGNPRLQERFPGGIFQFAQLAGQLPPDVLEDMMLIEAMDAPPGEGPPGAMPGGLGNMQEDDGNFVEVNFNPGDIERAPVPVPPLVQVQDSDEEDLEDSDEEEEEDISPMPRMLRNILGRLWGRSTVAEESSSSDEEPPRDDTGVD